MTTTPPAPTLNPRTDALPSPRIEILVTVMPGDAKQIWLYRSWSGGNKVLVPGANGAPVSGDFAIIDYEAPIGVPVTYYAQTADVSGIKSLLSAGSTPATVSVTQAWISDPLVPNNCLALNLDKAPGATDPHLMADALTSFTYASMSSTQPVVGQSLSVVIGQTRQAASNFVLSVSTYEAADGDALRALLLNSYVVCVRTPPRALVPFAGLAYVNVGDAVETPSRVTGRTQWSLPMAQCARPGLPLVISPRTYADLLDEAATYAALVITYTNYNAVKIGHN